MDLQMQTVRRLNQLGEKGNRMQKLQEEQGELAGAIRSYANMHHVAEEAIDVLLMLVSIHADLSDSDDLDVTPLSTNPGLCIAGLAMAEMFLCLSESIGIVAECNQKIDGVKSSMYKLAEADGVTAEEFRLMMLQSAMQACMTIMAIAVSNVPEIDLQAIYNLKMEKWEQVA